MKRKVQDQITNRPYTQNLPRTITIIIPTRDSEITRQLTLLRPARKTTQLTLHYCTGSSKLIDRHLSADTYLQTLNARCTRLKCLPADGPWTRIDLYFVFHGNGKQETMPADFFQSSELRLCRQCLLAWTRFNQTATSLYVGYANSKFQEGPPNSHEMLTVTVALRFTFTIASCGARVTLTQYKVPSCNTVILRCG